MSSEPHRAASSAPWLGLAATLLLVLLAFAIPPLTGWEVYARSEAAGGINVAPLHGTFRPVPFGPGTLPAILIAGLGWRYGLDLARRLPWRWLLLASYAVALVWSLSLALVDGTSGVSRVLDHPYEYLGTARSTTDVGAMLDSYVDRIDPDHPDHWPTHVAGHPPLAVLFFVALVRIGLGGDFAAGMVVTVIAATTPVAVLVALRTLEAEDVARKVAPFLALGPAAVFVAVSADGLFAAVAAWGLALLAIAATRETRGQMIIWSVVAGLVLGCCVMLSYGLGLLGFLALAVLFLARRWLPLPVAAGGALVVVLGFAVAGFAWWEAYPALHDRYWRGLAKLRPAEYWMWGNLAALAVSAGPLLGAGLACWRRNRDRVVTVLVAGAVAAVLTADLSRMSKAEVERIWLPFVPWLLLSTALLPERWRRPGLALQLVVALSVQHLLYTSW